MAIGLKESVNRRQPTGEEGYNTPSRRLIALTVMAMQVNATIAREREVRFDTDSAQIGADNRCTACISHIAEDFEPGTLRPCNRVVKGFGGSRVTNVQVGTLCVAMGGQSGDHLRVQNSELLLRA